MSIPVDDRRAMMEAEGLVIDKLKGDRHLTILLLRRIVVTLEIEPKDVFPQLVSHLEVVKTTPTVPLKQGEPGGEVKESEMESKGDSKERSDDQSSSKTPADHKDLLDAVRDGFSVETILKNRLKAVESAKGSHQTLKTRLKDKTKELQGITASILKASSSRDVTDRQKATFNNSLLAVLHHGYRCISAGILLPQATRGILGRIRKNESKLKKIMDMARKLPAEKWVVNAELGNITEAIESKPDQGDKVDADDW